ncbi:putative bifunctional diguanylate cyclase/phosphodiesterase [Aestuariibacter salexigens]|uniref:putative bifunctional diguanylate cyclase/phosphodiesterase n=1 Tax=Aestuariibacter salexigens TaxID=226010 RepID=UPI000415A9A6|nr:GGDEF domain-containing phosphodiesterase [Aestuariibacter salexigens]
MKLHVSSALKISFYYGIFAALWIVLSDAVILTVFDTESTRMLAQTYKGLAFILVTSVLLMALVLNYHRQVERANDMDSLTGLISLNVFVHALRTTMARRKPTERVVMGYLDIDDFQSVNKKIGFEAANAFLKELAHELSKATLQGSSVSRIQADRFASFAVLDESIDLKFHVVDIQNAYYACAHRHGVDATCCIGIAICPDDGITADELMHSAIEALTIAKQHTDMIQFHDKSLSEQALRHRQIVTALRHAIQHDELSLVYQPKYDLQNLKVTGLEVLVRWNDKIHGFIAPNVFIPLAEQNGLIHALTKLVVKKAARELGNISELGSHIEHVSINVSAGEFNDAEEMRDLVRIIEQYPNLAPYVRIEITETATLENMQQSMSVISDLQRAGLSFSIDDFGTGYTSLAMLKDLTVDEIKIDRSFVAGLGEDSRSETIINAIIGMAHSFDISVVAEGIETNTQLNQLRQLGCHQAQGYLLARPMTIDNLREELFADLKTVQAVY